VAPQIREYPRRVRAGRHHLRKSNPDYGLINIGNTPRTWSVEVLNADGDASNLMNLPVQ
jgi:hypothetical protein